jgi:hypothetical protein
LIFSKVITTPELQNSIIRKVEEIKDPFILDIVNDILDGNRITSVYQFTDAERNWIEESNSAYSMGTMSDHDEVTNRLDK